MRRLVPALLTLVLGWSSPAAGQGGPSPTAPVPVRVLRHGCEANALPSPDPALDRSLVVELASAGFDVVELSLRSALAPVTPYRGWRLRFEPRCDGERERVRAWRVRATSPERDGEIEVPVDGAPEAARARVLAVTAAELLRALAVPPSEAADVDDPGRAGDASDGPKAPGQDASGSTLDAGERGEAPTGLVVVDAPPPVAAEPPPRATAARTPAEPRPPPGPPPAHPPWRVRTRAAGFLALDLRGEGPAVRGSGAFGALWIQRRVGSFILGVELWPAVVGGGDEGLAGAVAGTAFVGVASGPLRLGVGLGATGAGRLRGGVRDDGSTVGAPVAFLIDPFFRVGEDGWAFELHVPFGIDRRGVALAAWRHELRFPLAPGVIGGLRGSPSAMGWSEIGAFFRSRITGDGGPGTLALGASAGYAWLADRVRCERLDANGRCTTGPHEGRAPGEELHYRGVTVGLEVEWNP